MINGILNDNFQSGLNNQKLSEFEVVDLNFAKKEIILIRNNQKFICNILQKDDNNQTFIIKINGYISSILINKTCR